MGVLGADLLLGGGGNDHVDGSDIVEGQGGNDLLDLFGSGASETIDVSANGGRVRFARDVPNIVTDLDDVEGVGFHAAGGTDNITVNDLTGTDAKTVDIDLNAVGGGGERPGAAPSPPETRFSPPRSRNV